MQNELLETRELEVEVGGRVRERGGGKGPHTENQVREPEKGLVELEKGGFKH